MSRCNTCGNKLIRLGLGMFCTNCQYAHNSDEESKSNNSSKGLNTECYLDF
jgi:hypothetical protein